MTEKEKPCFLKSSDNTHCFTNIVTHIGESSTRSTNLPTEIVQFSECSFQR